MLMIEDFPAMLDCRRETNKSVPLEHSFPVAGKADSSEAVGMEQARNWGKR